MTELDADVRPSVREPGEEHGSMLVDALRLLPRSAVVVFDRDLRIAEAFGEAFSKWGFEPARMPGKRIGDVLLPKTARLIEPAIEAALAGGDESSLEMRSPDGERVYRIDVRPIKTAGVVEGVFGFATEITGRVEAEAQVGAERQRFETAFENAPNGMALVGIDGRFLRVNPAMCDLTGYPAEELLTLKVADITHRDDMEEQVELVTRALAGEFDSYALEKRFTKKGGGIVWLMLAVSLVRDENGKALYVIAQTTNISANKRIEADLRSEAGQDSLTGLANRRQIERAIGNQIEIAGQGGESGSVLMADLDDFKRVNDEHGHETGDEVLRFFASQLKNEIRETDLAGRFGGDEFIVLMGNVDEAKADTICNQIMDHFDKLVFKPEGLALPVRVSVGHAQIESGSESATSVLASADRAMYKVKRERKSGA
jgi:diguanylate cyclase (GGDEF)-like protein/PAS domain S-box-containing protein